jgi:hypothetical protein
MSAAGPPQGARPPGGERRLAPIGGEHTSLRRIVPTSFPFVAAATLLLAAVLTGGCVSDRDDYGGSNDIGYSPMYGAYDGAYDGSWNRSPYYGGAVVIDLGPDY